MHPLRADFEAHESAEAQKGVVRAADFCEDVGHVPAAHEVKGEDLRPPSLFTHGPVCRGELPLFDLVALKLADDLDLACLHSIVVEHLDGLPGPLLAAFTVDLVPHEKELAHERRGLLPRVYATLLTRQ